MKQFPKNLGANIFSFASNVLVGILLLPYLINNLGISAYGLVSLAVIFSELIALFVQSINTAINREIISLINKKEFNEANVLYSTFVVILTVLSIVQLFIFWQVINYLDVVFQVSESLLVEARTLFWFVSLSSVIAIYRGLISSPLFATNRLDLIKYIDLINIFVRVLLILGLFSFYVPSIKFVGMAYFISACLSFTLAFIFSKTLNVKLVFSFSIVRFSKIGKTIKNASWLIVNQLGFLLFLKVDLYLVNKLMGVVDAGIYAIAIQVNTLIRSIASMLSGLISPTIFKFHANKEKDKYLELSFASVGVLCTLLGMMASFIIVYNVEIVDLWVPNIKSNILYDLIFISSITVIFHLPFLPLMSLLIAKRKVRFTAVLSVLLGVLNVLISALLLLFSDFGMLGVLSTSIFLLIFKNMIVLPIYVVKIFNVKFDRLIKAFITSFGVFMGCLMILNFIKLMDMSIWLVFGAYSIFCVSLLCLLFRFSKDFKGFYRLNG